MSFHEFHFNRADLSKPRPFGISAYMRIKNEEQFVRLAIESHLPFYDEIIAVYNNCTDDTEAILLDLQQQHPNKIKVFYYLPKVHPLGSPEFAAMTDPDDVHGFASQSNFAISKCSYSIAVKLDADHLALPHKLAPAIARIRAEFAAGADKIFLFSGLNVMRNERGELGMKATPEPFSGNGDIYYHRINQNSFFVNHEKYEHFNQKYRYGVPAEYIGVLYIHLKNLKKDFAAPSENFMPFKEFATEVHIATIAKTLKPTRRLRLALYKNKTYFALMYRLTGKYPGIRTYRLTGLYQDLAGLDFEWVAGALATASNKTV